MSPAPAMGCLFGTRRSPIEKAYLALELDDSCPLLGVSKIFVTLVSELTSILFGVPATFLIILELFELYEI